MTRRTYAWSRPYGESLSCAGARLGYATFVVKRRGHGGSEGTGVVGGEGLNTLRYGLPGEINDVVAAIEFLKARPEIDGKQHDRIVPVEFSRMVYDELQQRNVRAVVEIYPTFKVGGREVEGHARFDRVDGMPYVWADLTGFLTEVLRP
jgi:hypothetical protein